MGLEYKAGHSPLLVTRLAAFVAVGVVSGLALNGVPNVELVTAVCFMSGYLLGFAAGALTGGLTEMVFAGVNPLGSSVGILLIAQIAGMVAAGVAGSGAALLLAHRPSRVAHVLVVVGFGVAVTLFFDLLTNLAFPLMAGFSLSGYLVALVAGLPFAAIHVGSNVLVFLVIVVPLLPRLQKALAIS